MLEKHRKMKERQGESEIKIEFLLWLHDMEKPAPKPVPKAGSLFCMETKDLTRGLDRNLGAWPVLLQVTDIAESS